MLKIWLKHALFQLLWQVLKHFFLIIFWFLFEAKFFLWGFNSVSPERALGLTKSRSSISIWDSLTVFNTHLSEVSPFQLLMCSEMQPAFRGGSREFERGGRCVGHHGWLMKKILSFRWSKKAKITLGTKAFGKTFLSVLSNFLHFYI